MLPSGLPEDVDAQEEVARFLMHRSQFTRIMVKPAAFMPSPSDRETSVFRHGRQPVDELWRIGNQAAGARTLYGAAVFKANVISVVGLEIASSEPPPLHAAIRAWPSQHSDPLEEKAEWKALAAEIASAADEPFLR